MDYEKFMQDLVDGIIEECPCCHRHAQIYKRRLHATIIRQMYFLLKLGGDEHYVHTSRLLLPNTSGIGDFSKAKYFNLIEEHFCFDDAKKTSGLWRLTPSGVSFLKGNLKIPEFAGVFNDVVLFFSDERVSVQDCLGERFNYKELMDGQ